MRILFAAISGLGCMMIGYRLARRLTLREEALSAWSRLLEGLSASLSYVDDPLPDVLERLSIVDSPSDARLFTEIARAVELMRQNRALSFAEALDTDRAFADLDLTDTVSLLPLIRELGGTARAQQILRIDSALASLKSQTQKAADITKRQRRLFISLGSLGGLALFLCLIG